MHYSPMSPLGCLRKSEKLSWYGSVLPVWSSSLLVSYCSFMSLLSTIVKSASTSIAFLSPKISVLIKTSIWKVMCDKIMFEFIQTCSNRWNMFDIKFNIKIMMILWRKRLENKFETKIMRIARSLKICEMKSSFNLFKTIWTCSNMFEVEFKKGKNWRFLCWSILESGS